MRTRPTNNAIKRTIVVTTANVFLNFSLDFKNLTIGKPISDITEAMAI